MKLADEVTLDDTGSLVIADVDSRYREPKIVRRVQMVITAPRGRLIIYEGKNTKKQDKAIKSFVKDHLHD